jgi:plastocyanin
MASELPSVGPNFSSGRSVGRNFSSGKRRLTATCGGLWLAFASLAAAQTDVSGTVTVQTNSPAAGAAVVYAQPLDRPAAAAPGTFTLAQRQKTFQPAILGVPAGSTVDFPNQDAIFHNVFSLSSPSPFDLGLYRAGASKRRVFREPAVYRVFCNIHPQMSAVIVVSPTPHVTSTDRDGRYTLALPPGRYRLTATTGRSAPATRDLVVGSAAITTGALLIDERALAEAPHTNKFGKPYPKEAYREK